MGKANLGSLRSWSTGSNGEVTHGSVICKWHYLYQDQQRHLIIYIWFSVDLHVWSNDTQPRSTQSNLGFSGTSSFRFSVMQLWLQFQTSASFRSIINAYSWLRSTIKSKLAFAGSPMSVYPHLSADSLPMNCCMLVTYCVCHWMLYITTWCSSDNIHSTLFVQEGQCSLSCYLVFYFLIVTVSLCLWRTACRCFCKENSFPCLFHSRVLQV